MPEPDRPIFLTIQLGISIRASPRNREEQQFMFSLKTKGNSGIDRSVLDAVPFNILVTDSDLVITYANAHSIRTLKRLEHLLPIPVDQIVGTCIDRFHQDPSYQRRILSNPSNLPHTADIQLGDEVLSLEVNALRDDGGNYIGAVATWDIVTEERALEAKTAQMQAMLDQAPINLMATDLDLNIVYQNNSSAKTLQSVAHLLPISPDRVVGSCIDIFHKDPSYQRRLLADQSNLPHTAKIALGDEILDLHVYPVTNNKGEYTGPMVSWSIITQGERQKEITNQTVKQLAETAQRLSDLSGIAATSANDVSSSVDSVGDRSNQVFSSLSTVASAIEEMSASLASVSQSTADTTAQVDESIRFVGEAKNVMQELESASKEISRISETISEIAEQTNLLALNATIEAASAGEAGRGFAVVAGEVKELSKQTTNATQIIDTQISNVQSLITAVANSVNTVSERIDSIRELAMAVDHSASEQQVATNEIATSAASTSSNASAISEEIQSLRDGSGRMSEIAEELRGVIEAVAKLATDMETSIEE